MEESFVEVDGQHFRIWTDDPTRHRYDYDWLDGPNSGHGFSSTSRNHVPAPDDHTRAIRDFLQQIDPGTGYLAD